MAPLLGISGLHASILAGLVAVIGVSLPGRHDTAGLFPLVLLAWAAATLLSFSSVNVAVASKELRAGVVRLILSPNLAVMAIVGIVAACWLAWFG